MNAPPRGNKKGEHKEDPNDWAAIKVEFFHSEFWEVLPFYRELKGLDFDDSTKLPNNWLLATAGWRKEKREWADGVVRKEIAKMGKEKAKRIKTALNMATLTAEKYMRYAAANPHSAGAKAVKSFWEILRTEGGLPTRINENRNENTNFDAGKAREGIMSKIKKRHLSEPPAHAQSKRTAGKKGSARRVSG